MATTDDKDKKIPEVPHLEELTGDEKIPVSADGQPRHVNASQVAGLAEKSGFEYVKTQGRFPGQYYYGARLRNSASEATGDHSVAEGYLTNATGESSHAEGNNTTSAGFSSHAEGTGTIANNHGEHAEGCYNQSQSIDETNFSGSPEATLHSIGNGGFINGRTTRHNAFQVMQSGDIYIPDTDAEGEYYEKPMMHLQGELKKGGVTWGKIKSSNSKPDVTVIRLNQTISDPYSMLSGEFGKDGTPQTNVITWIRANSHRYVGVYNAEQGMVLRQLDDNDSTKYADGSDASEDIKGTNGGDVFMKMPDFWFKGVEVDGNSNIVDMHFSVEEPTDDGWTKWDGNTLIGVYEAVAENTTNNNLGSLFSRSGVTPSVSIFQPNFKAKARNRSNGNDHFQIVTYEAHQVMALLYMAWYGNTNGQAQIGKGTNDYPKVTGQTNVDGMNDTQTQNSRSINFWGIENWWGDIYELIDNLVTYNRTGGVNVLDYDGSTKRQMQGITNSGYITKMLLGEILDMLIRASGGSTTTYYCDYGNIDFNTDRVAMRSVDTHGDMGGPFSLSVSDSYTSSFAFRGTRLLYQGRVTVNNNPRSIAMQKTRSTSSQWKPIDLQYVYRDGTPVLRTGFDFNVCDVDTLSQVGKLSIYGLNINYDEIEFESNALSCDSEGNLTFNTDALPISVDMTYKGILIGTLKFHDISEKELIGRQREEQERLMLEQSDNV